MTPLVVGPLLPVMWLQGRHARRHTVRLPDAEGEPRGEVEGLQPRLHVWVVGESTVAGVGAATQQEAMPHRVAELLARHTGRAVAWESLGVTGANARELLARASSLDEVPRADVCILATGVNDTTGMRFPGSYASDVAALVRLVRSRVGAAVPVVVAGVPPMQHFPALPQPLRLVMGLRSRDLDDALGRWCRSQDGVLHVPTTPEADWDFAADGYHPGPRSYAEWSRALADGVIRLKFT